ncbi:hypothetical protein Bca52824_016506 [Brassica carinata]|uniref:Uncharacterized protein n=1 Tax=Brassica carinata TaxID=52824 RepID=A0A8X7W761_BRACI|nr:hypothetical protein Bca52824_016506 [Brassica carinata]
MGQYSYSQPSSSEEYDIDLTSLLQEEADLYADEAESENIVERFSLKVNLRLMMESRLAATVVLRLLLQLLTQEKILAEEAEVSREDSGELSKKKSGVANWYPWVVCLMVTAILVICMVVMFKLVEEKDNVITESLEELQRLKMRVSNL